MKKTNIFLTGFASAVLMTAAANAATTLATEPFVRSAIDHAKDYTDTELATKADKTLVGSDVLTTEATTITGAINELNDAVDTAVAGGVTMTQVDEAIEADNLIDATTYATPAYVDTAETDAIASAKTYTDTATATKANLQTIGAEEVALVDTAGQYVRSGISAASLTALTGDISGKADAIATGVGTGTKITVNDQGIVTNTTNASISDITDLQAALDAKGAALTYGATGTVMISTGTGYEWAATTPDTFAPIAP